MRTSFLFALFFCLLTSCSDNSDSKPCTAEAWQGSYIGTKSCPGVINDDYQFTVVRVESPSSAPIQNILLIDSIQYVFEDCTLSFHDVAEFESVGSLEEGILTLTADSCTLYASKR